MKIGVLISQLFPFELRPNHKCIHRPSDSGLFYALACCSARSHSNPGMWMMIVDVGGILYDTVAGAKIILVLVGTPRSSVWIIRSSSRVFTIWRKRWCYCWVWWVFRWHYWIFDIRWVRLHRRNRWRKRWGYWNNLAFVTITWAAIHWSSSASVHSMRTIITWDRCVISTDIETSDNRRIWWRLIGCHREQVWRRCWWTWRACKIFTGTYCP